MKTMTCRQLGGACDLAFQADNFEEMVAQSKAHGMEMFQKGDEAHLKIMHEMKEMMQKPGAMESWFNDRRNDFDALPEHS